MTLSFLQAFRAKQTGAISWEEYIHNLVARCAGVRHEADNVEGMYWELRKTDPFGYSIYGWSDEVERMSDTSPLEAVFRAYRRDTLDNVKDKLAVLDGKPAKGVKKSLAFLALQERRPDVLEFCLDQGGFAYEASFYLEAESFDEAKDPKTFSVLERSKFRRSYPRRAPDLQSREPSVVFDVGGKLPVEW